MVGRLRLEGLASGLFRSGAALRWSMDETRDAGAGGADTNRAGSQRAGSRRTGGKQTGAKRARPHGVAADAERSAGKRAGDRRCGPRPADLSGPFGAERLSVAAVRELYETTDIPVAELQRRTGLTDRLFRRLRESGGWRSRPQIAQPGDQQGQKTIAGRLARRIERAALTQLAALDARLAEGTTPGAEEIRTMRELMRLAREADALTRKTIGKADSAGRSGGGGGSDKSDAQESEAAYVEWMRAELTRRLDCLARESGLARADPGIRQDPA